MRLSLVRILALASMLLLTAWCKPAQAQSYDWPWYYYGVGSSQGYRGGESWGHRSGATTWVKQTHNAAQIGPDFSMPYGTDDIEILVSEDLGTFRTTAYWVSQKPYTAGCAEYRVVLPTVGNATYSGTIFNYGKEDPRNSTETYPGFVYNGYENTFTYRQAASARAAHFVQDTPLAEYSDYRFYLHFPAAYMEKRGGVWYRAERAKVLLGPSTYAWSQGREKDVAKWLWGKWSGGPIKLKGGPGTSNQSNIPGLEEMSDAYVESPMFHSINLWGFGAVIEVIQPSLYRMRYIEGGYGRRNDNEKYWSSAFQYLGIFNLDSDLNMHIGYRMVRAGTLGNQGGDNP